MNWFLAARKLERTAELNGPVHRAAARHAADPDLAGALALLDEGGSR